MTRGKTFRASIITALLLCATELPLYAGSSGRAIESTTGKSAAPTKEDSADYFSDRKREADANKAREADALRVKTIESIQTLLANKKNSRQEFELLLRLGELHVERADFMRDLEIQEYVRAYNAWDKTDAKSRPAKPPTASYKNSETSLYNAAQIFRKLVNKFQSHPRTDSALYSLARTLGRLEDENAVQYYKQLIERHPRSPLIPDAWLALGEFYFDKHKIKEATESYQQVMNFKNHRAYPYSVYKLGWCFYNSQGIDEKTPGENLNKSIAAFQLVVKLGENQKTGKFNLREEALKDLVMAFAEAEDTDRAWKYFTEIHEGQRFYTMLERLGGLYADAGKNAKAVEVYTRLVNESPGRKGNPQIHQKLLEIYDEMQKFPSVVETLKSMQNIYANESTWRSANKADPKILDNAKSLTERSMHRYGTMFHSRGQKIKNKDLENYAADIYTMYLESFSNLEPAYDIKFYLADIQMAQKKYAQASVNFLAVAKQKPKDGSHLKDAAFNAVDALSILNTTTKFASVPPPGQAPNPLEIPKVRKIYADTLDFYVTVLPQEKAGLPMRYTAAQIYFDYGHYPDAIKRFDSIATEFSATKQGQASARTIVAYYNEKSDWNNVVLYGKKFQANKGITQDANVKKFLDDSLRSALFNSAMASEKAKDYDKAAIAFLEFNKMFPHDQNADRALYNAALNQFKAGQIEPSISTTKQMLSAYPKSALAPDVMVNLAETYEAIARFQLAADTYKQFATTYPNDKRAPASLYNAGVLYRGVKQMELASASFTALYNKYPSHPAANDAIFESARIKEASGDAKGATSDYNVFVANSSNKLKDEALFASAKSIQLRLGSDPKNESARKDLAKIVATFRAKNGPAALPARQIIAKILFEAQEPNAKAFTALPLNNGKEIENQAAAKQAKLVRLAAAYQEVISLGNAEYTVASYYRLGEMHENFANALFNAPAPPDLDQKSSAAFKSQLEKAGFPLRDEAYKFFETAYRQSSEVETFTPWTEKTYMKMAQLAPEKHPAIDELSANPGYMSLKVSLNRATKDLAQ